MEEIHDQSASSRDQWHFQNALFADLSRNSPAAPKTSKTSNNSMSRQRYPCLACGEVKRWDQLTQHYKKFVQFDSLGIPCVPDQKQMTEKVYQHTALFFEKNFSRDRMPNYKDHIDAESKTVVDEKPETSAHPRRLQTNSSPFNFSDSQTASSNEKNYLPFCNPASLFFNPTFSLQAAAAGLKMPQIKLPPTNVNTSNKNRKRKLNTNTSSNNTPSQSRRFYKCLGCGAAKRWDRLTDHYRKYVVFGPLGQTVPPSLDTMTPEQYVHTMAFRDQGFAMDRMPQYKDHTEAGQDILEEDNTVTDESTSNSVNATDNGMENNLTIVPPSLRNFSPSQPNMEDFWENKNFADCKIICKGGEEILTHRLILAAHNEYFYQLLVSNEPSENELVVIMMPDHSSQDIANMLQQLYNFKVNNTAFLFDESFHEYRITDSTPSKKKKVEEKLEEEDAASAKTFLHSLMNYASTLSNLRNNENFAIKTEEELEHNNNDEDNEVDNEENPIHESEHDLITANKDESNEMIDTLIMKSGSSLNPIYTCLVPGCNFSVKKSLLCIKGHILAEHWSNIT